MQRETQEPSAEYDVETEVSTETNGQKNVNSVPNSTIMSDKRIFFQPEQNDVEIDDFNRTENKPSEQYEDSEFLETDMSTTDYNSELDFTPVEMIQDQHQFDQPQLQDTSTMYALPPALTADGCLHLPPPLSRWRVYDEMAAPNSDYVTRFVSSLSISADNNIDTPTGSVKIPMPPRHYVKPVQVPSTTGFPSVAYSTDRHQQQQAPINRFQTTFDSGRISPQTQTHFDNYSQQQGMFNQFPRPNFYSQPPDKYTPKPTEINDSCMCRCDRCVNLNTNPMAPSNSNQQWSYPPIPPNGYFSEENYPNSRKTEYYYRFPAPVEPLNNRNTPYWPQMYPWTSTIASSTSWPQLYQPREIISPTKRGTMDSQPLWVAPSSQYNGYADSRPYLHVPGPETYWPTTNHQCPSNCQVNPVSYTVRQSTTSNMGRSATSFHGITPPADMLQVPVNRDISQDPVCPPNYYCNVKNSKPNTIPMRPRRASSAQKRATTDAFNANQHRRQRQQSKRERKSSQFPEKLYNGEIDWKSEPNIASSETVASKLRRQHNQNKLKETCDTSPVCKME